MGHCEQSPGMQQVPGSGLSLESLLLPEKKIKEEELPCPVMILLVAVAVAVVVTVVVAVVIMTGVMVTYFSQDTRHDLAMANYNTYDIVINNDTVNKQL